MKSFRFIVFATVVCSALTLAGCRNKSNPGTTPGKADTTHVKSGSDTTRVRN